jgi:hypothetical protein
MSAPGRSYGRPFSPHAHFNQVPAGSVQAELRGLFRRWGLPEAVRVDNGSPWGSGGDLPTPLALWLLGLGLAVLWNPPRRPQRNGVVERSQGVARNWAEPESCGGVAELQRRLDEEDRVQREEYPHELGRPRLQVYPGLRHSGRRYSGAWEGRHWSWARVLEHLGGYAVVRRVDGSGKVGLYGGKLYVGLVHARTWVALQFDAAASQRVVSGAAGAELCRRPLDQFDAKALRDLEHYKHPRQ